MRGLRTEARGWRHWGWRGSSMLGVEVGGFRESQTPCHPLPFPVPAVMCPLDSHCHVPQATAHCSTAPWAPRCCCSARWEEGGQLSGAGVTLSWAHILHWGWPSPMPAWPTRANTAATTLAPARLGPPSACGWAVSDPGPLHGPCCWLGVLWGGWQWSDDCPLPQTPLHCLTSSAGPSATRRLSTAPGSWPPSRCWTPNLWPRSGQWGCPEPWLSPPTLYLHPCRAADRAGQLPPRPALALPPRHGTEMGECIRTGPRSCSFGDVQMFSLTPYVVNVTAKNPLGTASTFLPFLLENISECQGPLQTPHT